MKEPYTTCNGSTFNATHWRIHYNLECPTTQMYADYSTVTYAYTQEGYDAGYAVTLTLSNGVSLTHSLARNG